MLNIQINGEPREVASGQTVAGLLSELELPSQQVAVEVNLQLVPRDKHATYELRTGDRLEVVTFKGGG